MDSEPEGMEPVNFKTWVLKVSIHCEGCKRKMKKILHKVKGVYTIDIDAKQNRATVTGNVDAESLIQKLLEYGKHAELLPEKNPATTTTTTTTTNSSNPTASASKTEPKGNEKAISATAPSAAPAAAAAATAAAVLETEEKKKAEKGKAVVSPETPPPPVTASVEVTAPKADTDAPSQPEKNNSEKVATADAESKKGKEVKREESKVNEREVSSPVCVAGVNSPPANPFPANFQPSYTTVSYHTVHPTTSYAYYAPPPDMPSNYTYYGNPPQPTYPPPAGYPAEYYYSSESYYGSMDQPSPSAGSYDMFNDENPNACKLM